MCAAITRMPPNGPAGYAMSFALGLETTHFYLYYDGPMIPTPRQVTLSVDGKPIANLNVLGHTHAETGGKFQIMADLPGDMMSKTILPPMFNGTTLTVKVGQYAYPMPIIGYKQVGSEIAECAQSVFEKMRLQKNK
jgi:hypothetical protein